MRFITRFALALTLATAALAAPAQSIDPKVTQANIQQTICVSGYTATVRPPVSYTNKIKLAKLKEIGKTPQDASAYELDHIINLGIGGAPRDPKNLQLQLWEGPVGAKAKDVVEARMQRAVCAGKITLKAAQTCMSNGFQSCPVKF